MKKTKRATKRLQEAQPIYARYRQGVFALAYIALGNEAEAFKLVSNAFTKFTQRVMSIKRKPDAAVELYRIAVDQLCTAKEKTSGVDANCDESILAVKAALTENQMKAWLLRRYGGLSFVNIAKMLKAATDDAQRLYNEADGIVIERLKALSSDHALDMIKEIVGSKLNAKDPWSDITFRVEKHYDTGRRIELAFIGLLLGVALYFVGREAYALVRFMLTPDYDTGSIAITSEHDAADYWRNSRRSDSEISPNISRSLYERLNGLSDDTLVRVDFRFYDSSVMESLLTDDGRNLLQLYADVYQDTSNAAKVDLIIITGFRSFYSRYEIPMTPDLRESDFYPPRNTFYEYLMSIVDSRLASGNADYIAALNAYPQVFGSLEGFNSYMSTEFVANATWLSEIVHAELAMEDYFKNSELYTAQQAQELREIYETAIYRFTNGNLSAYTTAAYKITNEQAAYLLYNRAEIGEKLYAAMDSIVRSYGFRNLVDNSIFDGRMCAYSADMTKAQILELALEDGRFSFDGVALPMVQSGYPSTIDPLLYAMMAEDVAHTVDTGVDLTAHSYLDDEKYIVYVINDDYYDYNFNYVLSLLLPDEFIDSLYELYPAMENSALEIDYGYVYKLKYGHRYALSEYGILRRAFLNPKAYVATTRYKYFTLMGNPRG